VVEGKVIVMGNIIDDYAIKRSGSYQYALYENGGNTEFMLGQNYIGVGNMTRLGAVDEVAVGKIYTADNVIIDVTGDTTPSAKYSNRFQTNNTGELSITNFDDGSYGQVITIMFFDSVTTVVHNESYIHLAGSANWTPARYATLTMLLNGTWYEISRTAPG
jgi:hypothetical protein